ncbi:AAA-ATPase At2g46620 [Linum perenne]
MESDLKVKLKSDLELFHRAKQYYHCIGHVCKCSYLLYGPSGTGKIELHHRRGQFPKLRSLRDRPLQSPGRFGYEDAPAADEEQVGDRK